MILWIPRRGYGLLGPAVLLTLMLLAQVRLQAGAESHGLTLVGTDALMSATPATAHAFPQDAVIHLPPGLPSYNSGTRRIFRHDGTEPLELLWGGLFDDATDEVGTASFAEGAGQRYWNWFYYGGTHPSGTPWRAKWTVVLPGDYLVECSGGLTHAPASGWSVEIESGAILNPVTTRLVRFHVRIDSGIQQRFEVVEAPTARLPKTHSVLSQNAVSGLESIRVQGLGTSTSLSTGAWLMEAQFDTAAVEIGTFELGRFALHSGGVAEVELITQLVTSKIKTGGASPDIPYPGPGRALDPGDSLVLAGVGFWEGLEAVGLRAFAEARGGAWAQRFWQALPRKSVGEALRSALPVGAAAARSGRIPDGWALVSGPGRLTSLGNGRTRLEVLDDSDDIVVRPVLHAGRDALGLDWEDPLGDAGSLLTLPVRRQLVVSAGNHARVYDGTAAGTLGGFITGRLRTGHSASAACSSALSGAGTESLAPSLTIRSPDGKVLLDTPLNGLVSDLYRVRLSAGTMTVTRRPVQTGPKPYPDIEYDGRPHQVEFTLVEGTAAPPDRFEVEPVAPVVDAGEYTVKPRIRFIRSATGVDVSDNYAVTETPSTLRILPARVEGAPFEQTWKGAHRFGEGDIQVQWRVPLSPHLKPVGKARLVARSPAGEFNVLPGTELLPDDYAVECHFEPDSANYATAVATGRWKVELPVKVAGMNAVPAGSPGCPLESTSAGLEGHLLPGGELALSAAPAFDHAWGREWNEVSPQIWFTEPASLLAGDAGFGSELRISVPRQIRELRIEARAFQLPPRMTSARVRSTVNGPPYLGRNTAEISLSGACRESRLGCFELQIRPPESETFGDSIMLQASSETPNGPRAEVPCRMRWQPGTVLAAQPLVPENFEIRAGRPWEIRARAISETGRSGDWMSASIVCEAPLTTRTLRARTLPPAGDTADWFEPSETIAIPLLVWQP